MQLRKEKNMENKLEYLQAFVITVLVYIFAVAFLPMGYMTNDDASIQGALSGFFSDKPYPYHQFINCILGYIIAFFYDVLPQIQWWYFISVVFTLIGIYLLCRNWLILCKEYHVSKIVKYFLVFFSFICIWIYYISQVSFTIVPVLFSLGFMSNLIVRKRSKILFRDIIIPCAACLFASLYRAKMGWVIFCYLSMCILFYCLQTEKKINKKVFIIMSVYILSYGVVFVGCDKYNEIVSSSIESSDFKNFNSARIKYMDYEHAEYDENEELYQSVGLDRELSVLLNNWCFLDERINADSLNTILSKNTDAAGEKTANDSAFDIWYQMVKDNYFACALTMIAVFVSFLSIYYFFINKKVWNSIFLLFNVCGTMIILIYLCIEGRMTFRVYSALALPMIIIAVFLILQFINSGERVKLFKICGVGVCIVTGILFCLYVYAPDRISSIETQKMASKEINQYLLNHKQNLYVYSVGTYEATDNDEIYLGEKPNNAIAWGGSTWLSDFFEKKLETLNIDSLTMEIFKNDNCYFMTNRKQIATDNCICSLLATLSDYGAVSMKPIDTIKEYATIYQFVFNESLYDYSGLYTYGGLQYYYENGKRQTGILNIDGQKYYGKEGGKVIECNGEYISTQGELVEESDIEILDGVYEDRWCGRNVELNVINFGDKEKLNMEIELTDSTQKQKITIYNGDEIVQEKELLPGVNELQIDLPENVEIYNLKIVFSTVFSPQDYGGEDVRELSALWQDAQLL